MKRESGRVIKTGETAAGGRSRDGRMKKRQKRGGEELTRRVVSPPCFGAARWDVTAVGTKWSGRMCRRGAGWWESCSSGRSERVAG